MAVENKSEAWPFLAGSTENKEKIKNAKVLCVGAGGIGCELLKTLVCSGFRNIEVIDLDTIEMSNLNRQFLFRRRHVGLSKAQTAASAIQSFCPSASITAHHANVKDSSLFDVSFIEKFDVVLNGLDNLEARRHVNRLCLVAKRPLVESGTSGYLGQVTVHFGPKGGSGGEEEEEGERESDKKMGTEKSTDSHGVCNGCTAEDAVLGDLEAPLVKKDSSNKVSYILPPTECFECAPKPVPKSFPVCTLRNTPDRPLHCVVWAKDMLFGRLFGGAGSDLDASGGEGDGGKDDGGEEGKRSEVGVKEEEEWGAKEGEEEEEQQQQQQAKEEGTSPPLPPATPFDFSRGEEEAPLDYATRIYARVFDYDIRRLAAIEKMWTKQAPPRPASLSSPELSPSLSAAAADLLPLLTSTAAAAAAAAADPFSVSAARALGLNQQHTMWSLEETIRVFLLSTALISQLRADQVGSMAFDKDDRLAAEMVAAAANIRAWNYHINQLTLFELRGMAGNIIHAIATTNAIVSGLIVVEAIKILTNAAAAAARNTFLLQPKSGQGALFAPGFPDPPRKDCPICGGAALTLWIDCGSWSLKNWLEKVVRKRLAVNSPNVMSGDFVYEEGEGLDEDEVEYYNRMLTIQLDQLPGGGIRNGSRILISDQTQSLKMEIIVRHKTDIDEEKFPEQFILEGTASLPKAEEGEGRGKELGKESSVPKTESKGEEIGDLHVRKRRRTTTTGEGLDLEADSDLDLMDEEGVAEGNKEAKIEDGIIDDKDEQEHLRKKLKTLKEEQEREQDQKKGHGNGSGENKASETNIARPVAEDDDEECCIIMSDEELEGEMGGKSGKVEESRLLQESQREKNKSEAISTKDNQVKPSLSDGCSNDSEQKEDGEDCIELMSD